MCDMGIPGQFRYFSEDALVSKLQVVLDDLATEVKDADKAVEEQVRCKTFHGVP